MAGTFKVGSLQIESIDGLQTATVTHGNDDTVTFDKVVKVPTATSGTDTTQVATTAFTRAEIPNMLNASGTAPMYACRAWVNFNGTGTVAIRASGNVSSITDNGVGDYTVNFTTAMPDANYSVGSLVGNNTISNIMIRHISSQANSSFRFVVGQDGVTAGVDISHPMINIFR